jgi:predicted ester cyclase
MSLQENKALVRRFIEEIFNKRNSDALDEIMHPDFSNPGTNTYGLDQYKEQMSVSMPRWSAAGLHVTIEEMITEGDKIAYRWTWRETREGEQRTADGVSVQRIADGKIAESVFWMRDVTREGEQT